MKVRPGDDEFLASHFMGTANDIVKIIFMPRFPVIYSTKYRIGQIDADLLHSLLVVRICFT